MQLKPLIMNYFGYDYWATTIMIICNNQQICIIGESTTNQSNIQITAANQMKLLFFIILALSSRSAVILTPPQANPASSTSKPATVPVVKSVPVNSTSPVPPSLTPPLLKTTPPLKPASKITLAYDDYLAAVKPYDIVPYDNDYDYRVAIFDKNLQSINEHNSNPARTYNMGINRFTDITEGEFKAQFLKLVPPTIKTLPGKGPHLGATMVIDSTTNITIDTGSNGNDAVTYSALTTPDSITVDWQCKSGPVFYQGACGACYIIAPLDSIFITRSMYGQPIPALSIQQILSCDGPGSGNNGCNGGYFNSAFSYVKNSGVGRYVMYPYDIRALNEGFVKPCNFQIIKSAPYVNAKTTISSFNLIANGDCAAVVNQLQFSAIAVSVNARSGLQFYINGTYNPVSGTVDHGVTLVGYDPVNEYKIKNSWGTGWGNAGYAYVSASAGVCDYAMYAVTGVENRTLGSCP